MIGIVLQYIHIYVYLFFNNYSFLQPDTLPWWMDLSEMQHPGLFWKCLVAFLQTPDFSEQLEIVCPFIPEMIMGSDRSHWETHQLPMACCKCVNSCLFLFQKKNIAQQKRNCLKLKKSKKSYNLTEIDYKRA